MDLLKLKKKPEHSDEKKLKRGKIAAAVLLVMILVNVMFSLNKNDRKQNPDETVLQQLDKSLDSLIRSTGYDIYVVTYKGKLEKLTMQEENPDRDRLSSLLLEKETINNMSLPEENKRKLLEKLDREISEAEKNLGDGNVGERIQKLYARRIRFRSQEQTEYTFFQVLDEKGMVTQRHFIECQNN